MVKTLQELRMLSSATCNCQVTNIVMNSVTQLSELKLMSQRPQVSRIIVVIVIVQIVKIVKTINNNKNVEIVKKL